MQNRTMGAFHMPSLEINSDCVLSLELGYSTLNNLQRGFPEAQSVLPEASHVSKTARATQDRMKSGVHMPFEEFPLKEVDQLVHELDKVKPAGSTVIATPMEDSHHSPCLKEMMAIMVHTMGNNDQTSEIHSIYQYCPECKIAVRRL